jgi:hypothetical protein
MARNPSSGTGRDSLVPNKSKAYIQNNRTNIFPLGNIWSSNNLDLQSNLGVLRISPRLLAHTTFTGNNKYATAFRMIDTGTTYAVIGTTIFKGIIPGTTAFVQDPTGSVPTDCNPLKSDLEIFGSYLCATTDTILTTKLYTSDASAWVTKDTLQGGVHYMTYFKYFDRLYYAYDTAKIRSLDSTLTPSSLTGDFSLTISTSPDNYLISCMKSTSTDIWIGTMNYANGLGIGKILQWDGISAQVIKEFKVNNARGILAIAIEPKYDIPYVFDSNGIISSYNGSGFSEVTRLPFPINKLTRSSDSTPSGSSRNIHPNGMYFTKNGTLRMLISNVLDDGTVIENMPSGTWEWSIDTGLIHISSVSQTDVSTLSTITDYSQNILPQVGALSDANIANLNNVNGTMLAGATYTHSTNNIASVRSGFFCDNSNDDIIKKGYFVSTWFESGEIASSWNGWWTTFKKLLNSTDNIVFKYRLSEEPAKTGTITWIDGTSFTILNSSVDVSKYWTSGTGGEVEIVQGAGGGICAHITNAVNNAGTWTVTIDESSSATASIKSNARFQKWIKMYPKNPLNTTSTWANWALNTESVPRIQLKGCFTYTGAGEYHKGMLINSEDITSN